MRPKPSNCAYPVTRSARTRPTRPRTGSTSGRGWSTRRQISPPAASRLEPSRPSRSLKARFGDGLENLECRIEVRHDRRSVIAYQLPERTGEVRADRAGSEDLVGQHDAVHQMGGAHPAVGGDFVPPFANLNTLGLRPEKAPPCRYENHARNSAEDLEYQSNSPRARQSRADRPTDPVGVEGGHQSLIGRTNDGVSVCASPVRRPAVPAS